MVVAAEVVGSEANVERQLTWQGNAYSVVAAMVIEVLQTWRAPDGHSNAM